MKKPIVIIHGWSDNASSFKRLGRLLESKTQRQAKLINLANYVSMDDQVSMNDLVQAMHHAWQQAKLPFKPYSTDVIVHSTGGLIVRAWLTEFFTPTSAPIKHLVMLAPANFGSPLAHKGRSFIGRVLMGFDSPKPFQTGTKILKALELASPYTFELAQRDRFGSAIYYKPQRILTTVLVGDTGFTGIAAAANEVGSDGTVRISTANLNCAYMTADFLHDPLHPTYQLKKSNGLTAFGVMDGENHHTIADKDGGFKNKATLSNILEGLSVTDDEFTAWQKKLAKNNNTLSQTNSNLSFQNSVFELRDQYGHHVDDYFLEFNHCGSLHDKVAELFHQSVIQTTHAYGDDTSYRCLYINCNELNAKLKQDCVKLSLSAFPELSQNKNVGYQTFNKKAISSISFEKNHLKKYFYPTAPCYVI